MKDEEIEALKLQDKIYDLMKDFREKEGMLPNQISISVDEINLLKSYIPSLFEYDKYRIFGMLMMTSAAFDEEIELKVSYSEFSIDYSS